LGRDHNLGEREINLACREGDTSGAKHLKASSYDIQIMRKIVVAGLVASLALGLASPATAAVIGGDQLGLRGVQANPLAGADPVPAIQARTWIVADATTGQVLAAKKAHKARPPASTLKTLTSLTLLPKLALNGTFTATRKAANADGAKVGLEVGQVYTIEDLFYGLMLPSGNDAAIALAQANGGVKNTIDQMNAVAAQLQANDTKAASPNGLDKPGQTSSAYDLALIARAALQRNDFTTIVGSKRYRFPTKQSVGRGKHLIYNLNRLLTGDYRGVVGVKTGFTTKAGRTFIGAAQRKGRLLIFAGMGIKDSSEGAAKKALDWGFANLDKVTPVGMLVEPLTPLPTAVPMATQASNVEQIAVPVEPTPAATPTATTDPVAQQAINKAALKVPAAQVQAPSFWLAVIVVLIIGVALFAWNANRNRRRRRYRY
jgi:D-alanyl-D-alanine carboxypeptidase (penicillin-binding protein 5/6)